MTPNKGAVVGSLLHNLKFFIRFRSKMQNLDRMM